MGDIDFFSQLSYGVGGISSNLREKCVEFVGNSFWVFGVFDPNNQLSELNQHILFKSFYHMIFFTKYSHEVHSGKKISNHSVVLVSY